MPITKIEDSDDDNILNSYALESTLPPAWMSERIIDNKERNEEWYKTKAREINDKLNLIEKNKWKLRGQ